jgi:hypothetical protein
MAGAGWGTGLAGHALGRSQGLKLQQQGPD